MYGSVKAEARAVSEGASAARIAPLFTAQAYYERVGC